MRTRAYKSGFTLIEMLMVVAIIAILVLMVVGIAKRIDDQSKERLCRNTIALVGNALEQFRDFGYEYKDTTDYAGLTFPLDCNDLATIYIEPILHDALYLSAPSTLPHINQTEPIHDLYFSGSEALYFILSQVPDCQATLNKIDKSLLTNKGTDKVTDIIITIPSSTTTTDLPFTRIVDPWGTTLRYDYYPEYADYIIAYPGGDWPHYITYRNSAKKTFPVITSAGPDKQFDTTDDISNVK